MPWESYWEYDGETRQIEKRYRLIAGHDKDGRPIIFYCGERLMRTIKAAKARRERRQQKEATSSPEDQPSTEPAWSSSASVPPAPLLQTPCTPSNPPPTSSATLLPPCLLCT
jgi:hypothetical protein